MLLRCRSAVIFYYKTFLYVFHIRVFVILWSGYCNMFGFSMISDKTNPLALDVLTADSTAYSFNPSSPIDEVHSKTAQ